MSAPSTIHKVIMVITGSMTLVSTYCMFRDNHYSNLKKEYNKNNDFEAIRRIEDWENKSYFKQLISLPHD
jgi:hypothetical protein